MSSGNKKPISRTGRWRNKGLDTRQYLAQGPHCVRQGKLALTKSEAKRMWKHLRSRPDDHFRDALEFYRCPYCHHWHVGHHPQLKQRLKEQHPKLQEQDT